MCEKKNMEWEREFLLSIYESAIVHKRFVELFQYCAYIDKVAHNHPRRHKQHAKTRMPPSHSMRYHWVGKRPAPCSGDWSMCCRWGGKRWKVERQRVNQKNENV
jgi:hypothetical protein